MVLMDLTYYRFCSYLFNYQARGKFLTGQTSLTMLFAILILGFN